MVFPQQNLINPGILHLFVNQFNTLLSSGSGNITSFYQDCQTNCINFLSLYDIQAVLPGSSTDLENFIDLGRTTYNICGFAGSVSLYDTSTQGLNRPNTIITYNNNVTNPSNKITWMTIENEFWNLETSLNPLKNTTGYVMSTVAGSSTVTSVGINAVAVVGNMLKVNNEWRQIITVGTNSLTLDRPLTVTSTNVSFQIRDNLVNQTYAIDFTTLLYRIKLLRTLCVPNDIKIEIYIAKRASATQYNQIAPFVDRFLIEEELSTYPIYNDSSLQRVRQALLGAAANKTGTVTLFGTTLNGNGTQFTDDLGLNNSIIINGNEYIIDTIVNDTQATVTSAPTSNITTPTTYSNYVHFAPIFYINPANGQNWMISSPSKSYVDVYRLIAINGYTIGSVTQSGNSPIAYNAETNSAITGSTYMDGMSIFARTYMETIQSSVLSSPVPCSSCLSPTTYNISLSGSNPTCDNALNGSITVNFNGNNLTSPYTYTFTSGTTIIDIIDSNTTYTFGGLASGTWNVTVTDASLISSNSETITLTETFNPTITTSSNTINFNLIGGTSTYYISSWPYGTFFQSGLSNGTHSYTATNGTYYFIIGDSDSCVTDPIPVTVDNTATIVINASSTNPTCTTAANGTITANINSSALAPYTYTYSRTGGPTVNQVSNSTTNTYSSAIAGTWNVSVTDFNGNTSNTVSLTLTNTFAPTVTPGVNQALFNLVGGTAPYSIVGNTTPQFNQTGLSSGLHTFTSLPSGAYIFTVTDVNGCSSNLPATITAGANLSLNISSSVRPNCDITANGSVVLSPGGGTPPYTIYSATNGTTIYSNTTGTFTGLTSDPWTFTVRDSIGGIATTTLTLLDRFNITYTNTGTTLCISASGGSLGNYTVILNGTVHTYNTATTVNCYTGICGTNTFSVIDGNLSLSACVYTASTYLTCPFSVSLTATPVTCNGYTDASVIISASGGLPPYSYELYNDFLAPQNNTTGIFNNLPEGLGLWSAYTTDTNGSIVTNIFSLESTFNWEINPSNFTGLCVTVSGGSTPYQISIYGPLENTTNLFLQYTANTQGTYCFSAESGYRYSAQVFDGYICPGDGRYKETNLLSFLTLSVIRYRNPICSGTTSGVVTVGASGGLLPYVSYSATNGTTTYVRNNGVFGGLVSGTWTFYVLDSDGNIDSTTHTLVPESSDVTIEVLYSSNTLCVSILPTTSLSATSFNIEINNEDYSYRLGDTLCLNFSGCGSIDITACSNPFDLDVLYNFSPSVNGYTPLRSLLLGSDNKFYGTTYNGGINSVGVLYSANTLGNYGVLHNFSNSPNDINRPYAKPIEISGVLYGTTYSGGALGNGGIYSYDLNTQTYTELAEMTISNGTQPYSELSLASDGNLYGTCYYVPSLYRYTISSNTITTLHLFNAGTDGGLIYTAPIEAIPGVLYGVTSEGGANNHGTYYKYILSSNTFTVLGSFDINTTGYRSAIEKLVLYDGKLYGVSLDGGAYGFGTMWTITVSSDTLTKLFDFNNIARGRRPIQLFLGSNNILYGVTQYGGYYNQYSPNSGGVIFSYNPTTNRFRKMYDVSGYPNEPSGISGGLIELNNKLYGASSVGGNDNVGTIYSINRNPVVTCCDSTSVFIYSTGTTEPQFSINYVNSQPEEICISIDENNFLPPPYQVTIEGNTYGYNNSLSANCYTITGCGNTIISITNNDTNYLYTNLIYFTGSTSLGINPTNRLLQASNGLLYGVTSLGGTFNQGTIFSANTLGQKGVIYNFDGIIGRTIRNDLLQASNGLFYSVTVNGGINDLGVIFSCDTLGNYGVIFNFSATTGYAPYGLIQASNGILYGTTQLGGLNNYGTIYSCDTIGNYGVIHNFDDTNGSSPLTPLYQASNSVLYGTTLAGGAYGLGTIFSCDTLGNYGVIYNFNTPTGISPFAGLIESTNGYLYGTTGYGGTLDLGVIYKLNKNGSSYTVIHEFSGTSYNDGAYINQNELLLANNGIIYGTTFSGGKLPSFNGGTIFSVDQGDNYKIINIFSGTTYRDGSAPRGGLIQTIDGNLYGTNFAGGALPDTGTIFKLQLLEVSGCTYSTTLNVPCRQPLQLTVSSSTIPCLTNNGIISLLAIGGYPYYTYTLTNGVSTYTKTGLTSSIQTFTGLSANNWTATVSDISGNTDSINYLLSYINTDLTISNQDLCVSVTGTNNVTHYVYVDNVLQYTSAGIGGTFTTCLTGLTGCGTSHVLKVVDSDTGCKFEETYTIPCNSFDVINVETIQPFCTKTAAVVAIGVSGGSIPYTYTVERLSPSLSTSTPIGVIYNSIVFPYNYATFLITPPTGGGTYFGKIVDNNGTVITTTNFDLNPVFYADVVFGINTATVTFSGGSATFGWTNVNVNGVNYNSLSDGTYQYPISCGNNTITVQGVTNVDVPPPVLCNYTFTSYTPCDLSCTTRFNQPTCSGTKIGFLQVYITGGTPDYNIVLTNGVTTYTGQTSTSPFVFTSTGIDPINITGGTWTVTTTDDNGDTCTQTIVVDPTFDAFVTQLSTTGVCITISGGTPLYNVTIDTTNYGNNYDNGVHCFTATTGSHTAVITQPFAETLCPQTFSFVIPSSPITCDYVYTNPTCNNEIGSVLVSVVGGTGLYTYTITNGIETYTSAPPLSPYSSYPFNGLGDGTWQINVIDSDGSTCNNTVTLMSNFGVTATSYSNNSYTIGNICIDIQGGTPPYDIYIDNIIRLSGTTNLSNCFTATTNVTHTYRVVDSSPPCTIYTNVQMINDTTFDVPTNWVANTTGNCNNPIIPNFGITGGTVVAGGNITYTSTTQIAVPGTSGCFQNVFFRENYINPNPFTAGKPISATYEFQIDFGVKLNMVYAAPFLLTPITNPYFARYDILNSFGNGPANPITGIVTPPIASNYLNNTLYSGLVKIYTDNTLTYPPVVFSGYGIFIGASGSYNGSVGQIQYRGYSVRLVNYDISCFCSASGTTFVSPTPSPQIGLIGFTNPSCDGTSNGIISVSGSSGIPPYVYSATNGTTTYTNLNGIFNGLNSGTWYLSLVDSFGAIATLAQPITLYDTFYADVDSYSNGYCVTITGGTQPYYVAVNGNPLSWDYNFDTNCYSATCNTTSVITVRDSS